MKTENFNTQHINQALAMGQLRVVESVLRFIQLGLTNRDTLKGFEILSMAVKSHFLGMAGDFKILPDKKYFEKTWGSKDSWDLARTEAVSLFAATYKDYAKGEPRFTQAPFMLYVADEKEERFILEKETNCKILELDSCEKATAVETAYKVCKFNMHRYEQRLIALDVIVNNRESNLAFVQEIAGEVRAKLYQYRNIQYQRMLSMGLLTGDISTLMALKESVKTQYGKGMSIIDLLEIDGIVPTSWPVSLENKFRKEIDEA